ncbi:hypothetical protein L226DRAFT_536914 [Lentinus tigrinus ALCF2SS1-7]|uniref:F-box domain-containing protein n=1 Tax=Lentinus tigrinus ALCF2SS1-6 TaxID=1328759 RepID=A0A5C2S6A5_9APHY|nr:hypothetical protein L227DRAFT_654686 [Lentinus tigrinus ALCF2SS1-6]RPD72744.1 hypothetical protein L226DRAFT_536914 [Lentinus tigrinus ALCF2SS1-7]
MVSHGEDPTRTCALPAEIADNIIDHLYDDHATLRACALVSQAWLASCRYYLFYSTYCHLARPGRGLSDFMQWLSTTKPDCAPSYIVELFIVGDEDQDDPPEAAVQDLLLALPRLTCLRRLSLRGVTLSSRHSLGEVHLSASVRSLDDLVISRSTTKERAFEPMLDLLELFSEIGELTISLVRYRWKNPDEDQAVIRVPRPPRVRQLTLHANEHDEHERWNGYRGTFDLYRTAHELQQLSLALSRMASDSDSPDGFIGDLAQTLRKLNLNVTFAAIRALDEPVSPTAWTLPSLRLCTSLTELRLSFWAMLSDDFPNSIFDTMLAANAEILRWAPQSLTTVVLQFANDGKPFDSALTDALARMSNWGVLDDALVSLGSEVRKPSVVCVVQVGGNDSWGDFPPYVLLRTLGVDMNSQGGYMGLLKKMLPRTHTTGRLDFAVL